MITFVHYLIASRNLSSCRFPTELGVASSRSPQSVCRSAFLYWTFILYYYFSLNNLRIILPVAGYASSVYMDNIHFGYIYSLLLTRYYRHILHLTIGINDSKTSQNSKDERRPRKMAHRTEVGETLPNCRSVDVR